MLSTFEQIHEIDFMNKKKHEPTHEKKMHKIQASMCHYLEKHENRIAHDQNASEIDEVKSSQTFKYFVFQLSTETNQMIRNIEK